MVVQQYRGVPPGFYNFAALGANCVTASGSTSGSAVVLDACAGTSGQAWDPVLIGRFYELQPANSTNLCLASSGEAVGSAVVVETCTGASNQLWSLTVQTNSSNTGKGGLEASPCNKDWRSVGWRSELQADVVPGVRWAVTAAIDRGVEFRPRQQ